MYKEKCIDLEDVYQILFKYSVKSGRCITSSLRTNVLTFRNSQRLAAVLSVCHSFPASVTEFNITCFYH